MRAFVVELLRTLQSNQLTTPEWLALDHEVKRHGEQPIIAVDKERHWYPQSQETEGQGKQADVLLSGRFRGREQDMTDEQMAERTADHMAETLDVRDLSRAMTKIACKNDVKVFRLQRRINDLHQRVTDLLNRPAEWIRSAFDQHRREIDTLAGWNRRLEDQIRELKKKIDTLPVEYAWSLKGGRLASIEENIKSLFSLVEDIKTTPGWSQMGMLPHRVKTLEGQVGALGAIVHPKKRTRKK